MVQDTNKGAFYDLKFNYPASGEEGTILKELLTPLSADDLAEILPFPTFAGRLRQPEALGKLLGFAWEDFAPLFNLVICNSGNHALSCILHSLRAYYDKVVSEPFTYPVFKLLAGEKQYQVQTTAFDENGITPEGLLETVERSGARLVYLQPTIHNPTCAVMPLHRRLQVVQLARERDLYIIEDDAYRFLHPSPPPAFFQLMPERTFHIFSLSKPFNPFIKTAFVFAPRSFSERIVEEVRFTSSGTSSFLAYLANRLLLSGHLEKLIQQKRDLAIRRQNLAKSLLRGVPYTTYPTSFHLWISLPEGVSSAGRASDLYRLGVSVADGGDSAIGNPPNSFIRIALGAEREEERLQEALALVNQVLAR